MSTIFHMVEKERRQRSAQAIMINHLYINGMPFEERFRLREMLTKEEFHRLRERDSVVEIYLEHADWAHFKDIYDAEKSYHAPHSEWKERYY